MRLRASGECDGCRASLLLVVLVLGLVVLIVLLVLLLLLLAHALEHGRGDAVKVAHAVDGDAAAALGVLLKHTNALEALHSLALHRARGVGVPLGAEAAVLRAAVVLLQGADADGLAEVDVAGEGS